jgi:transposase-like protein
MASRQQKREWRKQFEAEGVRWVREQELRSIGSAEKLQYARRWLRRQERLPYIVGAAIGAVASIVGTIAGALITAFIGGCPK